MLLSSPRLHPEGGQVLTHLEWPEEQVEFSGFNVHREAADEQRPDLGTETIVVRARLDRKDGVDGSSFRQATGILLELREEFSISWAFGHRGK